MDIFIRKIILNKGIYIYMNRLLILLCAFLQITNLMSSGLHYTLSPAQRNKASKIFEETVGADIAVLESLGHGDIVPDIKHASQNGLSGKGVATVVAELAKRAGLTAAELGEEVDKTLPATRGVFARLKAAQRLKKRRDERESSDATTAAGDPKALADAKRVADAIAAELIAQEAKENAKKKSGAASGGGAPTRKTSEKKSRK